LSAVNEVRGRDVLLEVLASEGVRHIFGNPGTTELPLVDALASRDDFAYVLALQEATAVAMADGYAQATGRPAFINLHTSAGLGNAIGNLTNAQANATPLVVTAGQQDRRHIATDPLLAGDLVGLARPVSKWAHEVRAVGELGTIMRRAFHDAPTAPAGPVFVSLPMDLLEEDTDAPVPPPSRIERRTVPAALDDLADALASIDRSELAIVAADEVAASGAVDALVAVAEALGCAVFGAPLHSNVVFPVRHPLWRGDLAPAAASINRTLAPFRRVLFVGGRAFMVYPYTPGPALPPELELLHLSPDAHQLGRTWPTTLGLHGDPKATLEALRPLLTALVDAPALDASEADARVESLEEKARARYDDVPMHPMAAAHALVRALPPDATVVDEAITTGTYVRGFHHVAAAGRYFFCRGGGLGWGMPAALGVSLGYDREPVLCVVGDGSAMYSPQALWTAARERLPVVFAVVNNRQYLILKNALRTMAGDSAALERFVGMDIVDPPVDFVGLARSMGVSATLVERASDVSDAVRAAWDRGEPHLLELPITVP
jgi:benzoylformate decarboxylase